MAGNELRSGGVLIDRPGAADRDDALWVERDDAGGWRAWVHVADVAAVVRLGSATDVAACRRAETRYLPDRTITMLPPAEQAAAALRAGSGTLSTFVIALRVGAAGELTDLSIGAGQLQDPVAASYEEAAAALADPAHPLSGMLGRAHDLARTLLARRRAAGALAGYDLRRGWATDEDGRIVALAAPERNAGYLIVQELMIAANEAAARWAVARELALLFRNHRPGTATRAELADQLAVAAGPEGSARLEPVRQHLAMVLRPAVYEPRVGGHFGLNLPAYAHVTSPLRRYPDLVNQRILLAAAGGRPSPYRLDTLDETAAAVNLRHEGQRARRAAGLRDAAQEVTRTQLAQPDYRRLDDRTFGRLVRMAVTDDRLTPALAEEIVHRTDAGRLLPRDAAVALFDAQGEVWRPVRERLLRWLADEPAHAPTLLSLYRQQQQHAGELRWEERPVGSAKLPMFTARVALGARRSPARTAPAKRAARQQAALALVAELAGLPDPSADVALPEAPAPVSRQRDIPAGHPPAMAVNELAQVGRLKELHWSFTTGGSPHEPAHTCQVNAWCTLTERQLSGTGTGPTKAAAKAAAAAALWDQLSP